MGLVFPPRDKSRILSSSASSLARQAAKISQHVAGLGKVLEEQKTEYVQTHGGMGEAERDQVDAGADTISRQCRSLVTKYREEVAKSYFLSFLTPGPR